MRRLLFAAAAGWASLAMAGGSSAWAAPSCALPKGKETIPLVERNLSAAEKTLPAKAGEIRSLRSELQALAQRGEAFTAKASPLEGECRAIDAESARLKAAEQKLYSDQKPLRGQMAALERTWGQTILPRKRSLAAEHARYRVMGCGRTFKMPDEKAAHDRCEAWRVDLQGRMGAHQAEEGRIRNEREQVRARLWAMASGYDKAYQASRARRQKYQAALKAYRDERKAWDGQLRQVWAKSTSLIEEAQKQQSPAAQERREAVQKLRSQVAGIQEALRRVNRSILSDAAQRAEWEKATEEAMKNAWERGKGMAVDEGLRVLGTRLESANQELQRAVTLLSGETGPARRERLHAAVKLLGRERDEIRRAKDLVVDRVADAKKLVDAVDYGTSDPGDLEKSLKGAFTIITTTLGDPKGQQALKVGGGYAAGAGYAQSIVESSYDITAEAVSWRRIHQLNRNSEEYLKAVDRLKGNMERTIQKIQALEKGE